MKNKLILLAKADFAEYKRWYIITFLMAFLLLFAYYTYSYIDYTNSIEQYLKEKVDTNLPDMNALKIRFINTAYRMALFAILFFSFLILAASFAAYHLKKKRIFTAMLPASKGTKFIYIFLKNWIVFPAILFGTLWLCSTICGLLGGYSYTDITFSLPLNYSDLLTLLVIGTICFLSAILFKRFQFVFALLILLITWIILVFVLHFHTTGSTTVNIVMCGMILVAILATWFKFKYLQIKS